jgi:hypothetical protein
MPVVVVGGALASKPWTGGSAWVRLSWARGLARLGWEVTFVEEATPEADRAYFDAVTGAWGLRAELVGPDGPSEGLLALAGDCDLLVNITGNLRSPALLERFRRRAYVDLDPGWTQTWGVGGHHVYFTIAENLERGALPDDGIAWRHTRQPVVLDDWPATPSPEPHRFTTVATWRTPYGRLEHGGRTLGMKLDEFRKVIDLPGRAPSGVFELALDIHPAEAPDLEALDANGWRVVDAKAAARDPEAFRAYVTGSGAEFSVAQGVYVATRSGWFSDRSVRYLAAGRPVLVQDTGFGATLPVGEGLLTFDDVDAAAAGAARILEDHPRHAAAARRLAEEHFDSDVVLARFLEDALA